MNTKFWNLYKNSPEGKACIELFNTHSEDYDYDKILKKYCTKIENAEYMSAWTYAFFNNYEENNFTLPEILDENSFLRFVEKYTLNYYEYNDYNVILSKENILKKDDFRDKKWHTMPMSLFLYEYYGFCKPLLYPTRFDIIQRNCSVLDIELPPLPDSKKHIDYIMYYYDICCVWSEFQKKHDMSDAEFCACLYDFATWCCEEEKIVNSELPLPTNIWITGGGGDNGDVEVLNEMCKGQDLNATSAWTCNEQTKRGDIIVIYVTKPYSRIHSIWRANSAGIFNPFDYYQARTTICNGIKIPPICFNELKDDLYFQKIPIIKQSLQGVNGKKLTIEDYEQLLRFIRHKGGDTDNLPKLFECEKVDFGTIKVEKDVEDKILIPILRKLRYVETDWERQLSLKVGRNEKVIPDFVFFAKKEMYSISAPLVIEAKLDMSSIKERNKAFTQCFSYAKLLNAKWMGLCDKERLVIYKITNGIVSINNAVFESAWSPIFNDEKTGMKLNLIIGKDVVKNS